MPKGGFSLPGDVAYPAFFQKCEENFKLPRQNLTSIINLLQDDMTVPFISRYKRQLIGYETSPDTVYQIKSDLENFEKLVVMRTKRLKELHDLNICDSAVKSIFNSCLTMDDLNEVWSIYKPAKDQKLSAVALAHTFTELIEVSKNLVDNKAASWAVVRTFDVDRTMSASQALLLLLVSHVSNDPILKDACTAFIQGNLSIECKFKRGLSPSIKDSSKYKDYDGFSRKLAHVHSNQLLAIRRGENEDILSAKHLVSDSAISALTFQMFEKLKVNKSGCRFPINDKDDFTRIYNSYFENRSSSLLRNEIVGIAVCEAVRKNLAPSIISSCYKNAFKKAEDDALGIFAQNVSNLLMTPPLNSYLDSILSKASSSSSSSSSAPDTFTSNKRHKGGIQERQDPKPNHHNHPNVCGFDPGFSNGNKLAILTYNGTLIHTLKIYIPRNDNDPKYTACLNDFVNTLNIHKVGAISIGNGTGSFEALTFCKKAIRSFHFQGLGVCICTVVSEAGASVYSASAVAREEYTGVDISFLGAISIAKRLVNPLTELVKIDPKSLGVGMYQHDLSTKELDKALCNVLEKCVSEVGINIKDSNLHVLQRLPGMSDSKASSLLSALPTIKCRSDILAVKGIGPVTFKNIAGFIRVSNDKIALDDTNVHPDQYDTVKSLLQEVGFTSKYGLLKPEHIGSWELKNLLKSITSWASVAEKLKIQRSELIDILSWLSYKNYEILSKRSTAKCEDDILVKLSENITLKPYAIVPHGSIPEIISPFASEENDHSKIFHKNTASSSISSSSNNSSSNSNSSSTKEVLSNTPLGVGSTFQGVVQNITTFGIFVDLRVPYDVLFSSVASAGSKRKLDYNDGSSDSSSSKKNSANPQYSASGLLHVSRLGKTPLTSFCLGQKVSVKIITLEQERKRIALDLA